MHVEIIVGREEILADGDSGQVGIRNYTATDVLAARFRESNARRLPCHGVFCLTINCKSRVKLLIISDQ